MLLAPESPAHKRNQNDKTRKYNQRILQVENGTFTPLVFTCFGGMIRECSRFFSQAAELLAEKRKQPKSVIMAINKIEFFFIKIMYSLRSWFPIISNKQRGTEQHLY